MKELLKILKVIILNSLILIFKFFNNQPFINLLYLMNNYNFLHKMFHSLIVNNFFLLNFSFDLEKFFLTKQIIQKI